MKNNNSQKFNFLINCKIRRNIQHYAKLLQKGFILKKTTSQEFVNKFVAVRVTKSKKKGR